MNIDQDTIRKAVFEGCNVLWEMGLQPTLEELTDYWTIECQSDLATPQESLLAQSCLSLEREVIEQYIKEWNGNSGTDSYLGLSSKVKRLRLENRKLRERLKLLGVDPSGLV